MIPDMFLYTMLLNMLPEGAAKEIRDRRQTLNSTQRALDYLHGELARYNDSYVSKLHAQHDSHQLAAGPKNTVHSVLEKQMQDMQQKLDLCCAAFSKGGKSRGKGEGDEGQESEGTQEDGEIKRWKA